MFLIKGKELKKTYGDIFYKMLNCTLIHNGFVYEYGKNEDTLPFNPSGQCCAGGLYFTILDHLLSFGSPDNFVGKIYIDDDEDVWCEKNKFKVHKLVVREIMPFIEFININCDIALSCIKQNGLVLKYILNQTSMYCLESVKQYGMALQFVKEQTHDICLEAVKQDWYALQFINDQTEIICMEAVRRHGMALQFVKNQTEAICLEAVKQAGYALQFVKDQTEAICLEAVKQSYGNLNLDGYALEYVKEQTHNVCLEAVKNNGMMLKFVKIQTYDICLEAVKRDGYALMFVKEQTQEICIEAIKQQCSVFKFVNILPPKLDTIRKCYDECCRIRSEKFYLATLEL